MKTVQQFQKNNPKSKLSSKSLQYLKGGIHKVKKGKRKSNGCPPPFDEN